MALGKIKADTLEHSTAGSLDTQFVVKGSAKAFAHWNSAGVGTAYSQTVSIQVLSDERNRRPVTVAFTNEVQWQMINFTTSGTSRQW